MSDWQPHHLHGLDLLAHVPAAPAPPGGWPALLFLHGAGERGGDLQRVRAEGLPPRVDRQPDLPFVVLAPHCPQRHWWNQLVEQLVRLLEEVPHRWPVDRERISLTGISMGGYGTWKLAAERPELLACAVPICGGGNPAWAPGLAKLPVWTFHGTDDDIVPVTETLKMTRALEDLGAPVKLTLYEGVGHDSWTRAYAEPELLGWILSHRKKTS